MLFPSSVYPFPTFGSLVNLFLFLKTWVRCLDLLNFKASLLPLLASLIFLEDAGLTAKPALCTMYALAKPLKGTGCIFKGMAVTPAEKAEVKEKGRPRQLETDVQVYLRDTVRFGSRPPQKATITIK